MTCLLIAHARVDRVAIWVATSADSLVDWLVRWDGGLGFRCTASVPAPKEIVFLNSPPQEKFKPGRYYLLVLLYDRYIDNMEM